MELKRSDLSSADVTEICDLGLKAFAELPRSRRVATFHWRGHKLQAHHSSFQIKVDNAAGEPLCSRYD